MCTAIAFLVGGVFVPYLLLFVGATMALRGHLPSLFSKHVDAQIIAGTPYRRKESIKAWIVALPICLLLACVASSVHRKIAPEKPDLAKTIIDGVKSIVEKQHTPNVPAPVPTMAEIEARIDKTTLHDLFRSDFVGDKTSRTWRVNPQNGHPGFDFEYAIVGSSVYNSKFLVYYISSTENTRDSCVWLATHSDVIFHDGVQMDYTTRVPGDSGTRSTSTEVFTGNVYIYHETYMPQAITSELTKLFAKHEQALVFRSVDYLSHKQLEMKVQQLRGFVPPPLPEPRPEPVPEPRLDVTFTIPNNEQHPKLQWRMDNEASSPVQAITYHFLMWDIDQPRLNSGAGVGIQAPTQRIDFINSHDFANGLVVPFGTPVNPGDRIFGVGQIACLGCKDRGYWLYFRDGQEGWYAETPVRGSAVPSLTTFAGDPETVIDRFAPNLKKLPIGHWAVGAKTK